MHNGIILLYITLIYTWNVLADTTVFTSNIPSDWLPLGPAHHSTSIQLHIYIKQTNINQLQQLVDHISVPYHNNGSINQQYTKYWSNHDIHTLIQPTQHSINTIINWLSLYNLNNIESTWNNDMIQSDTSIGVVQKLLNTTYHVYYNQHINQYTVRCIEYTLPNHILPHIDIIGPTNRFPSASVTSKFDSNTIDASTSCNNKVTPQCIEQLYHMDYLPNTTSINSVGIASYLEQYISINDLQQYFRLYVPSLIGAQPTILGYNNMHQPGTEASLDIQYIMGLTYGINTTLYYTSGRQPYTNSTTNEPFLKWLYNIQRHDNIPYVISTSYGDNEGVPNPSYVPFALILL